MIKLQAASAVSCSNCSILSHSFQSCIHLDGQPSICMNDHTGMWQQFVTFFISAVPTLSHLGSDVVKN